MIWKKWSKSKNNSNKKIRAKMKKISKMEVNKNKQLIINKINKLKEIKIQKNKVLQKKVQVL